tara:strand:- start:6654 stop:8519 length:1866 start_codon:yes stop_codon:yes gene_type:complete
MVQYGSGDNIFDEEDDFEITNPEVQSLAYPNVLSSSFFPEEPTYTNPDPMHLLPFLVDKESHLKDFPLAQLTQEQIDAAYSNTDFSPQKKGALAKFGFGLLRPTVGGRIGEVLAEGGQQLASDLSQIKTAEQSEAKQNAQARIKTEMDQRAQNVLQEKEIWNMNRELMMNASSNKYEADLKKDQDLRSIYHDQLKSSAAKFMDYQLEGTKPKKVTIAYKDAEGDLGTPFDAFVVQNITENGGLSAPQYYKPTNNIGTDGLPEMQLIQNPQNIVSIPLSQSGTPDDYRNPKGMVTFRDILTGLQTTDRALLTLDELEQSFLDNPSRAGFIAGIKGRVQTYMQIFSDLYGEQFNGFFSEDDLVSFNENSGISKVYETGQYKGQKIEKFQNMASSISVYLNDPNVQQDIANGDISPKDIKALESANKVFDQLGASGYAQMQADKTGGTNFYGENKFKGTDGRTDEEEKQAIFKKLRFFDTDLPANQVRANSIIYAIARARKSSGRLNLDDIERAAKDLNIYGDSSADVITKLGVLRQQLTRNREDALANIRIMFGQGKDNYYDQLIDMGYATYNRDRTLVYVQDPKETGYYPVTRTDVSTLSGDIKGMEFEPGTGFDYSIGVEN